MTDEPPSKASAGPPDAAAQPTTLADSPLTPLVIQQPSNETAGPIGAAALPHAIYAYDPRTGQPVGPPIAFPGCPQPMQGSFAYGTHPEAAPGTPPALQAYPQGTWSAYGPVALPPINIVVQNTNNAMVPYGSGAIVRDGNRSRGAAALLAFFFGGFGAHKFYLGQTGVGILYLVFCWTFLPFLIGYFEAVGYLLMSDRAFDLRYNARLV
jgi:TM2 domain-containing membrane protein YozV